MDFLKTLYKQPYWVIALVLGVFLVLMACVNLDHEYHWIAHPPKTYVLVSVGLGLIVLSGLAFSLSLWANFASGPNGGAGVDLTRVKEKDGIISTLVGNCEIRVVFGRLEDYATDSGAAIVGPCNEYFDDQCLQDRRTALGSYVNHAFEGQVEAFVSLLVAERKRKFGTGVVHQMTDDVSAESFGAGRCILLAKPLGRAVPVALISTTTQRAGQGLTGQFSYLFEGTRELVAKLADARIYEAVMPVLGAGHGRIDPSLAFIGQLLALCEATRLGHGGQRLKRATIVVFKRDDSSPEVVNKAVVRKALALIGSTV
jgi:hypothetical protein